MQVEVTILDSSYNIDEKECNFINFMAYEISEVSPTTTSLGHHGFKDDQDKFLDTYKELLKEYIKFKKR